MDELFAMSSLIPRNIPNVGPNLCSGTTRATLRSRPPERGSYPWTGMGWLKGGECNYDCGSEA